MFALKDRHLMYAAIEFFSYACSLGIFVKPLAVIDALEPGCMRVDLILSENLQTFFE